MSKIQTELAKATGLDIKRKEDRQDYIARLMVGVAALEEPQWAKLSAEAQDWFNDAADVENENATAKKKNAKAVDKDLPDFPDLEEEQADEPEVKATTSRRGSKAAEPELKVGVMAKITNKRGKSFTGKVVEIDAEVVVLEMGNGDEEEIDRSRIESFEIAGEGKADEPEGPKEPGVGDDVKVTTKRGKEITGKIVELDEEVIVLDVDGKDEEFDRSRVESITLVGSKGKAKGKTDEPADEPEDKPAGRRGGRGKTDEPAADTKPKRASNPEGVSIGTRIKELMADDLEATEAEIGKALKKEGIEFRDNTLKLNYVDCSKFIAILKAKKLLK